VLIGRRAVVRRELSTGEADHCARNLCMLGGYRHGSRQLLSAISPILLDRGLFEHDGLSSIGPPDRIRSAREGIGPTGQGPTGRRKDVSERGAGEAN